MRWPWIGAFAALVVLATTAWLVTFVVDGAMPWPRAVAAGMLVAGWYAFVVMGSQYPGVTPKVLGAVHALVGWLVFVGAMAVMALAGIFGTVLGADLDGRWGLAFAGTLASHGLFGMVLYAVADEAHVPPTAS